MGYVIIIIMQRLMRYVWDIRMMNRRRNDESQAIKQLSAQCQNNILTFKKYHKFSANINLSHIQCFSYWNITVRKVVATDHLCTCFLAIHKASRNDSRRQQLIALSKLLKHDAARKSLATDSNALQHAITSQLIKHQRRLHFPCLQTRTVKIF